MPLYDQLMNTLKHQINTQMAPHDKMLSERELATFYNMSRTTVRSALKQLEIEGYIYKRHGKGTFVSEFKDRLANLSKMYSFTEQMITLGKVPSTKVLHFSIVSSDETLAPRLSVDVGKKVYRIERLRLADNEPFMYEVSYLPVELFPKLTKKMIEKKPLYSVLNETYQQSIRLANEEFFAGVVSGDQAKILEISDYSPVFTIERTTFNHHNELIEYTQSIARGDKFRYHITHERKV
ncbi:GntR family transcriptional regulator [Carnobacteriaceae bacterium zg-ZUI252]|nr:GntR family transcriptional regulator [Carnobacteriaceae bacterium zg-ZUI252]